MYYIVYLLKEKNNNNNNAYTINNNFYRIPLRSRFIGLFMFQQVSITVRLKRLIFSLQVTLSIKLTSEPFRPVNVHSNIIFIVPSFISNIKTFKMMILLYSISHTVHISY